MTFRQLTDVVALANTDPCRRAAENLCIARPSLKSKSIL